MPRRDSPKWSQAAKIYAETHNASETARRIGVHRTTVQRWLSEPGFIGGGEPVTEFPSLVPKALQVLDTALDGGKITTAQIRAALEVVKASDALRESTKVDGQSLADLISALDSEAGIDSD